MTDLIGKSLGRYHILEQLGEGGMAMVYRARDTRLDRDVAVKVILPYRQHSEKFLKRFEREAKSLARLSHPNIVGVIDYGEQDGFPYLVMEYLPGGTLKQKLGKPMDASEAARLLAPIAYALELAHRHNIIHRDIKPANILLTETGQSMLSDFGIAKMLESEDTADHLTGTGIGIGTPDYMAPEQGMGHAIDGRADIYSLGITFYELVTGRKPYRADTPMAILHKQLSEPLPRPSKFVPGLPAYVENVLIKALAKDAANRYQDMGEFALALDSIAGQKRPSAPKFAIPKKKILTALIGLLVVALIGAGGYFAFAGLSNPQEETAVPNQTQPVESKSAPFKPQVQSAAEEATDVMMVEVCRQGICVFAHDVLAQEFSLPEFAGWDIQHPSWSNDGTRIVFNAITPEGRGGFSDLYVLDIETESVRQLTDTPDNEVVPVWSPVNDRIAFHRNCQLWVINADGTGEEELFLREDQCVDFLRWSPDGQFLAWVSPSGMDGSGGQHISVYDLREKKAVSIPLQFNKKAGRNSAWDPDGSAFYAYVDDNGDQRTYKLNIACVKTGCGEADIEALAPEDFQIPPEWYPNYRSGWGAISPAFDLAAPLESLKKSTLYVCGDKTLCANSDRGEEIRIAELAQLPGRIYEASWKLDGTAIVLSASDGRNREDMDGDLFLADLTNKKIIRITETKENANDRFPVLSPDGREVAFHSNCSGKIIDVETKQIRTFLEDPGQCVDNLRWSPGGRWLAWLSAQSWEGVPSNKIGIYDSQTGNTYALLPQVDFRTADHRFAWLPDESALYFEVNSGRSVAYQIPPECFMRNCPQDEWGVVSPSADSSHWLPEYYPQWDGAALASTFRNCIGATDWITNPANGQDYRIIEAQGWQDAENQAAELGGYLVTVNDVEEENWLREQFGDNCGIGFSDVAAEGDWVWSSGETSTYVNWCDGEPNDYDGAEDVAMMGRDFGEKCWNDVEEHGTFIVERNPANG